MARNQIETVLTRLGLNFIGTKTGKEAWDRLNILAHQARKAGVPMRDKVAMVLTDLEMPEMDGFTLTRQMKEDDVLGDVPVVIHSWLSGWPTNRTNRVGGEWLRSQICSRRTGARSCKDLALPAKPALWGSSPGRGSLCIEQSDRCLKAL